VTDRGRPIAEIMPLRAESMTLDERLARLEEAGEITLPRGRKERGRVRAARVRGRPVAETLLEDRR
jgi:antitoxin (DNA-binding transcriptional repressor) of toxin-antitoxin stability system